VCAADRSLVGYEILTADLDAPVGSARTSARALLDAFTDVDLDLVAPHHPAYLTVGPALLLRLDLLPVAPDRVVLQIECDGPVHADVAAALERLDGLGYVIAASRPGGPEAVRALRVASLARVNVGGLRPEAVAGALAPLAELGVGLHATGISTLELFEACREAGCEAFQGAFRALPELSQPPLEVPVGLSGATMLLSPDLDFEQLEGLIARDLGLSYRLLRYANSAFFSRRREIGTVREAIVLLGERMTRRWALVVALADPRSAHPEDGLLGDALLRARMLEQLALDVPGLDPDHAFTVGLFSMLPSLVNRPMHAALQGLGLPAHVEAALLDGRPPYGDLLDRTVCHLDGDRRPVGGASTRLDDAFREALAWVEPVRAELERIGPVGERWQRDG
jgi:EAL and modified HD-GYP domain-containing signal transduction protein